jgi:DNA-binding transcriptional regulator YdaS (Cro superfamily)
MEKTTDLPSGRIIDLMGGPSEVAKMCNVSPQAVSQWRVHGIPKGQLVILAARLERATGFLITRRSMFNDYADIWPELAPK